MRKYTRNKRFIRHAFFRLPLTTLKEQAHWEERACLTRPGFNREPEEVIASDLIASSFPSDVGEGGVKLAIPLVSAVEYVYPRRQLAAAGKH